MTWQDGAFAVGSACFTLALIPLLRNKRAMVPLKTSLMTAFWIAVFAYAHATIGFYWASFTEATASVAWFFVALRRSPWTFYVKLKPFTCLALRKEG